VSLADEIAGVRSRDRRQPVSTPIRLWRIRAWLLAGTALLYLLAATAFFWGHATVKSVHDSASPALLDAMTVRAALSDADRAVWTSFRSGEAALIGPGRTYQNNITAANQRLEHLAQLDTVGSEQLQTIGGQLVNYQALVEQADASYRAGLAVGKASRQQLGFAYLSYASSSLHAPGDGLLARVDELVQANREALAARQASRSTGATVLLAPAAAALLLLTLLVLAQIFLRRTFRRAVNLPLLAATAVVFLLPIWVAGVAVHRNSSFDTARTTTLAELTARWADAAKQADERSLDWQSGTAVEGEHLGRVAAKSALEPVVTGSMQGRLESQMQSAARTYGVDIGVHVLALLIAGLVFVGLKPRMDEYEGWRE